MDGRGKAYKPFLLCLLAGISSTCALDSFLLRCACTTDNRLCFFHTFVVQWLVQAEYTYIMGHEICNVKCILWSTRHDQDKIESVMTWMLRVSSQGSLACPVRCNYILRIMTFWKYWASIALYESSETMDHWDLLNLSILRQESYNGIRFLCSLVAEVLSIPITLCRKTLWDLSLLCNRESRVERSSRLGKGRFGG